MWRQLLQIWRSCQPRWEELAKWLRSVDRFLTSQMLTMPKGFWRRKSWKFITLWSKKNHFRKWPELNHSILWDNNTRKTQSCLQRKTLKNRNLQKREKRDTRLHCTIKHSSHRIQLKRVPFMELFLSSQITCQILQPNLNVKLWWRVKMHQLHCMRKGSKLLIEGWLDHKLL